LMWKYI